MTWPVWNFTFWRRFTVQADASAFGFQLMASSGTSLRPGAARIRCSPAILPVSREPVSANWCGSISWAGGGMIPIRKRPPTLAPDGDADGEELQAAAIRAVPITD